MLFGAPLLAVMMPNERYGEMLAVSVKLWLMGRRNAVGLKAAAVLLGSSVLPHQQPAARGQELLSFFALRRRFLLHSHRLFKTWLVNLPLMLETFGCRLVLFKEHVGGCFSKAAR